MIVKPYEVSTRLRDVRERNGAAAEKQMAHYLHRAYRSDQEVCVLHQLRLEDADQPEPDGSAGACQIDHLVVHRWGFFLVESKSVAEAVEVRSDGDGSDEWNRIVRGRPQGIPSPIGQAERQSVQSVFLRTVLQRHREELVGRYRFGLRTVAKVHHGSDRRSFLYAPMQLVIAISDSGRIDRQCGWKPPEKPFRVHVTKADLVPKKINAELDRHRAGGNPLKVRPGEYGLWSMDAKEVRTVAEFLAARHRERSHDSTMAAKRPGPETERPKSTRSEANTRTRTVRGCRRMIANCVG